MPDRPDFRLYHSNALDVLAGLLAQELRRPALGQALLAPDIVLIPQVAMRRWLQATLAQAHGIAANLEFLTPGEFVQRALDANVAGKGEDLDADGLRWRLYAALADPALLREPVLRPLRTYLHDGGGRGNDGGRGDRAGDDALKPWSLAGELAAVFEKYQAWRRDWLLGWEAGHGKHNPQAALWRRIGGGRRHRARRIDEYLARFGDGDAFAVDVAADDSDAGHAPISAIDGRGGAAKPLPAGMPSRLFAFATLNVSPDVLRVIATQARVGTLHFYMPTPTRKYWGDLATLAQRLRAGDAAAFGAGAGNGQGNGNDESAQENPLLQAWGAAGSDFMAVMGSYEIVHPSGDIPAYADPEQAADDDPARDTLLRRLQRDLLHRRAPPATPWRNAVDRGDNSLQVHACHTRLREVQVLHDQLRGLLEDPRFDPPLQPREIAVLAPDIDPYAPYIQAVFGGLAGRADFIPYALADTSALAAEPLAEVFLRLLALPVSRFGLHEVLDLLATPAIAAQAGLDAAALDRLRTWLHAAGARWGLDAAHRERFDAPRDDAYTWTFALDRLLLGHACGADVDGNDIENDGDATSAGTTPALIAGVAPYTELEGSALDALDALIRLLRVLARHERVFANAMTPAQWRERLLGLLAALLPATPRDNADQRTLERLRTLLDEFANGAQRAGFDAPVPPDVIRAHCQAALAQADTRAPLLTGGVSFGRMVPMRLLPFRAICVLGLNDGDYPRRDPAGGLNQLTAQLGTSARRRGDRSLRDDDRFLFLQLFAAAADVFYLSFIGADPRDGSRREPSVLVAELLDVAGRYHADGQAARDGLLVRHPLQPFSPAAFGARDGSGEVAGEQGDVGMANAADAGGAGGASMVGCTDAVGPGDGADDDSCATRAGLEPRRFSYRGEWRAAAQATGTRTAIGPWLAAPLAPMDAAGETVQLAELRAFLRDPPAAFLRQRLTLRLPDEADDHDDLDPLVLPGRGLQRQQLQQAVFDALVEGWSGGLGAASAGSLGACLSDAAGDGVATLCAADAVTGGGDTGNGHAAPRMSAELGETLDLFDAVFVADGGPAREEPPPAPRADSAARGELVELVAGGLPTGVIPPQVPSQSPAANVATGQPDALYRQLRARALLPSGPLGQQMLDQLLAQVQPYAAAFAAWRGDGKPASQSFDLDLGDVRLQGRLEQLYPGGLARLRFDTLNGPTQIAHGLDWLVLSALGDARPLLQFADTGAGPGPLDRPSISAAQARAALRALLTLRAWGLREPLPFLSRAGWCWYGACAAGKDGWAKAEAQWRGSARSWAEAGTASARLALRGRDPFDDEELGHSFREIATLVFDAVVHGRVDDPSAAAGSDASTAPDRAMVRAAGPDALAEDVSL